jgi:hypothetical protein
MGIDVNESETDLASFEMPDDAANFGRVLVRDRAVSQDKDQYG